jgi:hypothetical protein
MKTPRPIIVIFVLLAFFDAAFLACAFGCASASGPVLPKSIPVQLERAK